MWCLQLFQDSIHSFWEGEVLAQGPGAPLHLVGVQAVGHGLSTHFIIIIDDEAAWSTLPFWPSFWQVVPWNRSLSSMAFPKASISCKVDTFLALDPTQESRYTSAFPSNLSRPHSFALQPPVLLARVPYQSTRTFGNIPFPFPCNILPFPRGFPFPCHLCPFPRGLPFPRALPGLVARRHQDQPPKLDLCFSKPLRSELEAASEVEELFFLLSLLLLLCLFQGYRVLQHPTLPTFFCRLLCQRPGMWSKEEKEKHSLSA